MTTSVPGQGEGAGPCGCLRYMGQWVSLCSAHYPDGPQGPPPCPDHMPAQHRDRKPPWCGVCGWSDARPAVAAQRIADRPYGPPTPPSGLAVQATTGEARDECPECGAPRGVACDDAPEQQHVLRTLARELGVMGA